jgi:hypothetical protein
MKLNYNLLRCYVFYMYSYKQSSQDKNIFLLYGTK